MTFSTGLAWSLLLFVVVAVVTPGANNLLAASSGARYGLRRSARLLAGIGVSMVSAVAVSATGLGGAIQSMPVLRVVLRAAGTAYLLWLAYRISRSRRPAVAEDGVAAPPGFRSGLLVTWLNPKAWTVSVSTAAGYSGISNDPLVLGAVIAAVFAVVLVPNLLLWCAGGRFLATTLRTDTQWRAVSGVLALLLVASLVPMWLE
jgi:threonine/homoserine/homoserine lactone efflux protein